MEQFKKYISNLLSCFFSAYLKIKALNIPFNKQLHGDAENWVEIFFIQL